MKYQFRRLVSLAAFCLIAGVQLSAQDKIVNPEINYAGSPRQCRIAGLAVTGIEGYEDNLLIGISNLSVGQEISVPGTEITDAVKRFWKHGLFSDVSISIDSIIGRDAYLHINLAPLPRVSQINYYGLKKSEREDMQEKLGMMKDYQITPSMIDRAKILAKKYFDDKGFNDAEINIMQHDDLSKKNFVILDVTVDKKQKKRVKNIIIVGNDKLSDSKIKGNLFKKGAFAKTHEARHGRCYS